MPGTDNEVVKRELVVFYVLDTSGSMNDDGKIGILNEAMRETTNVLTDIAKSNSDAELKIAVLQFNSGAQWVTEDGPVYLEDFTWDDLSAGGLTDVGEALKELYDKMSRETFLKSETGQFLPIVIFMSDGYPTDNWEKKLAELKNTNKWFARATKIGFALGEEADEKILARIVGNPEAVVKTNDMVLFKKLIRFVSATASMLNSSSRTLDTSISGKDIVKKALKEKGEPVPEPAPEPIPEPAPVPEPPTPWDDEDIDDWD